jgi:hypothetical protein
MQPPLPKDVTRANACVGALAHSKLVESQFKID